MDLHPKKRIEIIIEEALSPRLLGLIDEHGAKGYTLLPEVRGRGNRGARMADAFSGIGGNCMVIVIAEAAIAERLLPAVQQLLKNGAGIISVSDTSVLRNEHF